MKKRFDTKKLTFMALMLAITLILDLTPLGAIPLGPVSATIIHIPTIITGIILGPIAGLIMGTLLGLVSLLHALTRPATPLDPLFINPLVSVLPRRSEEHTSELQSRPHLVCRLLLEKKKKIQ